MYNANEQIKVSVCVVAYNQAKYIEACLDSLLKQDADFPYEIIVGDDASTDGTADIIQRLASQHPEKITPVLHEKNVGAYKNLCSVHERARGTFVCHVDGDDLAFPDKLSSCVAIFEREADVNIVFHRMKMLMEKSGLLVDDSIDFKRIGRNRFKREDFLALGSIGCNSSKMYRKGIGAIPESESFRLDFDLHVRQVGSGEAFFLDKILGVYRVGVGISSSSKIRECYFSHLEAFLHQYPECSAQIGANGLFAFLADIRAGNKTWKLGLRLWLRAKPLKALIVFLRLLRTRLLLRIPGEA